MKKICKICEKEFETNGRASTCSNECAGKLYKKINRFNMIEYNKRIKEEFFEHYGSECAICGESNKYNLTVDHIHDDGAKHRKIVGDNTTLVILDLKKQNWPTDYVQTLCYNCNNKKKMLKQTINGASGAAILRAAAVDALGAKCRCCGESDKQKLEIRPKNGNIKLYREHYKSRNALLSNIIDSENVRNEFEVLCVNCHRRIQYKRD